jgi:phosphoribosylglycinamide formyltransferase-1
MLKIGVLVSGGGTNLQALIDAQKSGIIKSGEIVTVVSNKPDVYALERAKNAGIDAHVITKKECGSSAAFDLALCNYMQEKGVDLVVLAGFLAILGENFLSVYKDRILNVHPSLIPSFCGDGFYGLHVHEAVLARGNKVTGATVHFVDEGTDTGPILMQKAVAVKCGDTPEVLQRRVMEEAEWEILPAAINAIANGKVTWQDGKAFITE